MTAIIGHGGQGSGEVAALLLRPGNASFNTAADHVTTGRLPWPRSPPTCTSRC
ncbi:hypothetical protein [Nonomuraea sp. NPDC049028]|uniref:hypothetical protein n=1 Tax=Nonomuraea sp. NPDC049028 TaxID=3364348 RepID=UPI0037191BBD